MRWRMGWRLPAAGAALWAACSVLAGATPASASAGTASPTVMYGQGIVLPFTGLANPWGIALDSDRNVYVTDYGFNHVLELPAGATTSGQQITLPFKDLTDPNGVGVDAAGNTYITDSARVLELPAESRQQITLPFTGLQYEPLALAVDGHGNAYVADTVSNRIVELPAGATSSSQQITLPFAGLDHPVGVAVDTAGDVFATSTYSNDVFELPAGAASSSQQITLPFAGLDHPLGVAVDSHGNVYVADEGNNRVLELPTGATSSSGQITLPFTDNSYPIAVAADADGNVYVTKHNPQQVVELPVTTDKVTVTSPGNQTNRANQMVSIQIQATSSTDSPLTYTATNLPPGLSINKTTGLITGRLQMIASTFRKSVTVTAAAVDHGFSSTTFTWTVTPVTGRIAGYRNMCVSDYNYLKAAGTKVVINPCNNRLRERWTIGPKKSLVIQGMCLTDTHGGLSGTKLTLQPCRGSASQQWTHHRNGKYTVAPRRLCMTDPHRSTTSNTQLTVQSCHNRQNQRWSMP
jgi:streptogramin lyase